MLLESEFDLGDMHGVKKSLQVVLLITFLSASYQPSDN